MRKFVLFAAVLFGATVLSAAQTAEPAAPAAVVTPQAKAEMRPLSQWTPFQIAFFPGVPTATENSNVFGIKTGQPASGGIGRVFGLEASWIFSGTDHIKGIQACWVHNQNETFDGIQASFVSNINFTQFRGLQAAFVYCQAGDFMGAQGALVSLAKDWMGVQSALAVSVTGDGTGFQAAGVNVVNGKFTGVQCGIYSQVEECSGLQLGLVNISGKKGFQIGLVNYIEDALIPVFPILNFSF